MTTYLPDAADPDRLTDALRRHGVLSGGRVREVAADTIAVVARIHSAREADLLQAMN